MFFSIESFLQEWQNEATATERILDALTDASLQQEVTKEDRTLGRIAWHIVTSIDEMLSRTGLQFSAASHGQPVPSSAKEIADSFRQSSASFVRAIREQWTDDTLEVSCDMYGEQWPNGLTLRILIQHLIHHRGQMTVLMRQAGLQVPGVYGPSRDEWGQLGMEAPTV